MLHHVHKKKNNKTQYVFVIVHYLHVSLSTFEDSVKLTSVSKIKNNTLKSPEKAQLGLINNE